MDPSILIGLFVATVLSFFACQINVGADAVPDGAHGHDDGHGHAGDKHDETHPAH